MPCVQCKDGSIQCGPNPKNLCQDPGNSQSNLLSLQHPPVWEDAGVFSLHLYVAHDEGGCKIRVVPCIPQGEVDCRPVRTSAAEAS